MLRGTERDWLVPCLSLIAAEYLVLSLMAWSVGFQRPPPITDSAAKAVMVTAAAIVFIVLRADRSPRRGYERAREKVHAVIAGMILMTLQTSLLSWAKTLMPHYSGGFWADPLLADLDKAILGVDAWVLAQKVPAASIIEWTYPAWIPIMGVAHIAILLMPTSRKRTQAIITFFGILSFGSLFQFILPSSGPLFYKLAGYGDRFVPLVHEAPRIVLSAQEWLWKFHTEGTVKAGIGISAMPSMHVAEAMWLLLLCRSLWRPFFWPAAFFFVITCIGSVSTGFHYVSDSLVGALAALVIWKLVAAAKMREGESRALNLAGAID